ncbi:LysE family translocator [Sneathiella sp.]|uniref:LysE family translocator n=1 Tax=Sneathiella sp. TaxID=1964365 RepID=UPI00356267D1
MSFELWISFFIATTALLAIPGPTVMIVISCALDRGRASGWATVPGVTLGDFTAMTASLLGAGAVLATSAALFGVLKFAGALYLIWLGVTLWRSGGKLDELEVPKGRSMGAMFRTSYLVTALNPKSIVFFVAFVPQFVNVAEPMLMQFVILEATFLTLAAINVAIWAALVGRMQAWFKNRRALKILNRVGASFLIGAGVLTAAVRRVA